MCFGAPSNPPVMPPSPPLRKITTQTYLSEEVRPFWNGRYRTAEEVTAIEELLVAVPQLPPIEQKRVEYQVSAPVDSKGNVGKFTTSVADFLSIQIEAPVDSSDERMSATKRRYADKATGMLLTQNEAYQIRSDARLHKMLANNIRPGNEQMSAVDRPSGVLVSKPHGTKYFGVGTEPNTPKPTNARPDHDRIGVNKLPDKAPPRPAPSAATQPDMPAFPPTSADHVLEDMMPPRQEPMDSEYVYH